MGGSFGGSTSGRFLPMTMDHIFSALKYEYEKSNLAIPKINYKNIQLQ